MAGTTAGEGETSDVLPCWDGLAAIAAIAAIADGTEDAGVGGTLYTRPRTTRPR